MKTINVVAAIIVREGKVFATQRGYDEWRDWWEFPGGKAVLLYTKKASDQIWSDAFCA